MSRAVILRPQAEFVSLKPLHGTRSVAAASAVISSAQLTRLSLRSSAIQNSILRSVAPFDAHCCGVSHTLSSLRAASTRWLSSAASMRGAIRGGGIGVASAADSHPRFRTLAKAEAPQNRAPTNG